MGETIMPKCQGCGSHVSQKFVRVFGVDGEVQGCQECQGQSNGRAFAGLDDLTR